MAQSPTAERAVRGDEAEARAVAAAMLEAFEEPAFLIDADRGVLAANEAAARRFGPAGEGRPCGRCCGPAERDAGCPLDEALRTGRPAERHRLVDGRIVHARVVPTPLRDPAGRPLLLHVLENRPPSACGPHPVRATREMVERMLRVATEDAPLAHRAGRALEFLLAHPSLSEAWAAGLWRRSEDRLVLLAARGLGGVVPAACREVPLGHCLCGRAGEGRAIERSECTSPRAHTPAGPHAHAVFPLRHEDRVVGVLNVYLPRELPPDAEARHALDAATLALSTLLAREELLERLEQSEERFERIFSAVPDPVVVCDLDGRLRTYNPAAARTFGLGVDDLERVHTAERLLGEPLPDLRELARRLRGRGALHRREGAVRGADGRPRQFEIAVALVHLDDRPHLLCLARDVTEVREYQARLAHSAQLAALGTVSAAVAHEVRTPLAYALANIDYCVDELRELLGRRLDGVGADLHEIADALAEARNGLRRIRAILRDVRNLARTSDDDLEPVDVNAAVRSAVTVAGPELRRVARLEVRLAPGLPPVRAHVGRLGQVVLNLLENAAHAVAHHGGGSRVVRVRTELEGAVVAMSVSDTGPGVPPERREAIFEPFVTSRAGAGGSGLGLWICRNLVQRMGGRIDVDDAPGGGARFTVRLPAAAGGGASPSDVDGAAGGPAGGGLAELKEPRGPSESA